MSDPAESDEALMLSFARGDAAAFEELYRRHESRVFRYLCRNVRDPDAASDLMQDVWFAVARSAARYQPTARFTTWLYTLAHHRMVDGFRARREHQSLDAPAGGGDDGDGSSLAERLPADPRAEPAAEAEARDDSARVLRAVGQLPAEQRDAFLLKAEAELSVEEIAAVTGTSFETAKSRLRYARSKLRELLAEYA
jgi:RNA polymerase sigma-70 factor (ECF subfamily)